MKYKFHTLLFLTAVLLCAASTVSKAQSYSDLSGKKWLDRASAMTALSETREQYYAVFNGSALNEKEAVTLKLRLYNIEYAIDRLGDDLKSIPDAIWEAYNQTKSEYNVQATAVGITANDQRLIFDEFVGIVGK